MLDLTNQLSECTWVCWRLGLTVKYRGSVLGALKDSFVLNSMFEWFEYLFYDYFCIVSFKTMLSLWRICRSAWNFLRDKIPLWVDSVRIKFKFYKFSRLIWTHYAIFRKIYGIICSFEIILCFIVRNICYSHKH